MDNKIVLISEFTQLIKHKSLTFRMKKNPNHRSSCDQNACIPVGRPGLCSPRAQ